MKHLFVVFLIFASPSVVWSQAFIQQSVINSEFCTICGQDIKWESIPEKSYWGGISLGGAYSFNIIPDSLRKLDITIPLTNIKVCKTCYQRYNEEFQKSLRELYDDFIKVAKGQNEKRRKLFNKLRDEKRREDILKQIKDLQDELEGKKKDSEVFKGFGRTYIDTLDAFKPFKIRY